MKMLGLGILLFLPLVVGLLMNIKIFDSISGSEDGWLGFWGGYLGAILSVFGAFWLFNKQSMKDKEEINETIKAQMKITATFAYYEYKLAENKELIKGISQTEKKIKDLYIMVSRFTEHPSEYRADLSSKLYEVLVALIDLGTITYLLYGESVDKERKDIINEINQWYSQLEENRFKADELSEKIKKISQKMIKFQISIETESKKLLQEMEDHMNE
ncbi:hypothetical protein [Listeria seeligeri]|uniref:hypothetical protein n=1 Tax=Listeria seeligeri TaxID=1640 RepID=UPI001625AE3B|nr:hypothetical protein [Listeria seeligeri]MBC1722265.1 hypothetical protein [Listeria seeligeri]MBF2435792.1 hypothetical protein [Listeria seeligeri]